MTTTPTTPTVYTGRSTSWALVAATSVSGVLLVATAATSTGHWAGLAVPFGLAVVGVVADVLTACAVRATAGPNGFTIHWGVVGWPRCHYRLDDIERAEVIDLPWWSVSWGFWWTPRRTCCTLRSGPTVRLHLGSGRRVTVTVPDPRAAVAAIVDVKPAAAS